MAVKDPVTPALSALVSTRGIVKVFGGVRALDDISIDLYPGEVHCLAGENGCGKSTLIKVISGVLRPESGVIVVDGIEHIAMDTNDANRQGIQVIYQDFSLFPSLSVAENISLTGDIGQGKVLYSARASRPRIEEITRELGIELDLDAEVGALSVADKQLTAICRALVSDARVIVMDEPTTALTHHEIDRLFTVVNRLRARGVALLFVSHKLEEVMEVSQRVTIMRSGRIVTSAPTDEFDTKSITRHMTGRDLAQERFAVELSNEAPEILSIEGLSSKGFISDISLTLREGEVLGITGLLGSGRAEIAEVLFGLLPRDSGSVRVDGELVPLGTFEKAMDAGLGYVPEDRLTQGLFLDKSIADNMIASTLSAHTGKSGLIDRGKQSSVIQGLFRRLRIKAPNVDAPVRTLSGGNAQRVVLAKWIAKHPKILILNGPTVGVDVGSKREILEILNSEAADGMGIIVISDDLNELEAICHRVLIVRQGRIVSELSGDSIRPDEMERRMSA